MSHPPKTSRLLLVLLVMLPLCGLALFTAGQQPQYGRAASLAGTNIAQRVPDL
jgi:hypothetical protein